METTVYLINVCHKYAQELYESSISPLELDNLAREVPVRKIRELAKNIEMITHLNVDWSNLGKVLNRWDREMKELKITHQRSYLVHCLRVTGLTELADK